MRILRAKNTIQIESKKYRLGKGKKKAGFSGLLQIYYIIKGVIIKLRY